jgi:hypothetical protein
MPASILYLVGGLATALFEEQGSAPRDGRHTAPLHPVVVVLGGLALAAMIVALTTLIALGVDAFLHLDLQFDQDQWAPHE